jgi:hypothetical protein
MYKMVDTSQTVANGLVVKCGDEIRLHKIDDKKLTNIFYVLSDLTIDIEEGFIVFVEYDWDDAIVSMKVITYVEMEERIEFLYQSTEFYENVAYILHRLSEALIIK